MIENSFQLIRTNPALTTNVNVVVSSGYTIYLEAIQTNKQLSSDNYRHYLINKENYYEDILPEFYNGLPPNLAFDVKYDNDNNIMYKDYIHQFDDIYWSGARNVQDQWYEEEYEYFAPLYIRSDSMPTNFIILRVDDSAVYDIVNNSYMLGSLNADNFRPEVVDKWKSVSVFNLTYQSNIGYWLYNNYTNNKRFPLAPFELDVKNYNFSRWYGIEYTDGVYTQKDLFLDDELRFEQPHYKLEKFITDGYRANNLIFPYILNLKFLFDDTPASPTELNQYNISRYYGFYAEEMDLVTNITTYQPPQLIPNLEIINNVFIISGTTGSTMPFNISQWNPNIGYWIYANNDLHQVDVYIDASGNTDYKILSKDNISINDINNDGICSISYTTSGDTYMNIISGLTSTFNIDTYYDCSIGTIQDMYGDLYLIEINNKYHVLKNLDNSGSTGNTYYINSDWGINSNVNYLEYWIQSKTSEFYTNVNIQDNVNKLKPLVYPVY